MTNKKYRSGLTDERHHFRVFHHNRNEYIRPHKINSIKMAKITLQNLQLQVSLPERSVTSANTEVTMV